MFLPTVFWLVKFQRKILHLEIAFLAHTRAMPHDLTTKNTFYFQAKCQLKHSFAFPSDRTEPYQLIYINMRTELRVHKVRGKGPVP